MKRAAALETKAEIRKLARILGVGDEELAFATAVPAAELAAFREAAVDVLYDDNAPQLRRAADAARLLPEPVLVRIAGTALGPTLCALLAGHVSPRLAVAIAERLDIEYLAQVAARMDPRRAVAVVTRMPVRRIRDVAAEMAASGEHVAMGRFVAHLPDEALLACVDVLDATDLLLIAFVLEGKREAADRVARLVHALDEERVDRLAAEARSAGLDDELTDLLAHLPPDLRRRVQGAAG